jgi:hypothetical protein
MHEELMKRIADIFSTWPSDAELGRDLGVPYPTISAWKQRGSIPVAYWRDIIRAARKRGHAEITADLLVDLHAPEPKTGLPGVNEDSLPFEAQKSDAADQSRGGHFTRFRHLRRAHFASLQEVNAHISALRDEWKRR